MKVYVAAPYGDAPQVLAIHSRLCSYGIEPTATWAHSADGIEDLRTLPLDEVHSLIEANKRDVLASHVLLALPREGVGGEMFCEVARALEWGTPVIWLASSRVVLTAFDEGVFRVNQLCEGLGLLRHMARLVRWSRREDDAHLRDMLWSFVSFYEYERAAGRLPAHAVFCHQEHDA